MHLISSYDQCKEFGAQRLRPFVEALTEFYYKAF